MKTTNTELKALIAKMSENKYFTKVDFKKNILEATFKIEKVIGDDALEDCNETIIKIAAQDVFQAPYKINERYPSITKEVKAIWKQIVDKPSYVKERNMGITIYCDSFEIIEKEGELYGHVVFGENGGVTNGGHTIAAFLEAIAYNINVNGAFLEVKIREYSRPVTKQEIADNCTALNSIHKQTVYGEGEVSGAHEAIKENVEKYLDIIQWVPDDKQKSNDDDIIFDPIDIIDFAVVMTPPKKPLESGKFPKQYPFNTGASKSTPYKGYVQSVKRGDTPRCEIVFPYLPEILELVDHMMRTFKDIPKKYLNNFVIKTSNKCTPISGVVTEKELSRLILMPILSAMGENFKYDRKEGKISTYTDFITLYDTCRNNIWDCLNDYEKRFARGNKYLYCNKNAKDTWDKLHSIVRETIRDYEKEAA